MPKRRRLSRKGSDRETKTYRIFYGKRGSKYISDDFIERHFTKEKARVSASRRLYPKYTIKKMKQVV